LYVTVLSFLFAAPICLFAAIYLTQFASKRLIQLMHPVIDILAGIPSVIYGMWGILIIVPFVSNILAPALNINSSGYSILAGGIVLAVMCIPYMLNMLIETFNTVPYGLKEAVLSLGATHWESIKHVIVNMVQLTFNPFEAGYPLPALIANNYGEMLSIPMYDSALMFAAFVLLVIILIINFVFRYFIYKTQKA
jgi:phosphate transport system permease protein